MANNRRTLNRKRTEHAKRLAEGHGEHIAQVAYELYEERGRVDGHDLEDWLNAEAIVRKEDQRSPMLI